ncbi:hypothetical protein BCR33DRAFT_317536 [Rhizoclosmatium globosum]|uniref:Uncharacterized protein n=1 Tax=Rhizoclosmatium globosum TaxID=329046 RepID=A0A1Y2CZG5_9FUNG|nr:hypothetical protein BCR33DRAFT_317536 [Rhizoclosmatium globosum]|eukprot:ORY52423.1 hypothetical protein BCR33DRAFT_317536 [Rhizoclosmatium globosum]
MQANSIGRLTFAYNLPKTCTYRKQLLTLSLLWVAVEFVKVRAPITATGFTDSLISTLESPIGCIVYKANLEYMRDRTYPTMESTAGVSELLFGDALGCVRSNSNCVGNKTQFVHGPQLMGAVGDGDTIIGLGFYMNISSSCACVQPMNVPTPLLSQNQSLIKLSDLAVYPLDYVIQDHHISSTAIILSPRYCNDSKKVPMCVTNITDIMDVEVLSTFSTDGTTASIALVKSQFYQTTENQQIGGTAIHGALSTILRTNESNTIAMSGILKAAFLGSPFSGNATQKVSLEAAMEMLYSILLRAGIQRTFDTDGLSCPRYKIQKDRTMVFLNSTGSLAIFFVASLQLVLCIFSLVLGSYWIFSTTPLSPAIRVIREPKHFLASLAASPFAANLQGTGNAPASEIWSRLDVVARIGESIHTVDFEVGEILLSRPEEVIPLANDRKYR